jgi:hypothetical protein
MLGTSMLCVLMILNICTMSLMAISKSSTSYDPLTDRPQPILKANAFNTSSLELETALMQLSAEEEDALFQKLHSQEWPYRLTCPHVPSLDGAKKYSVIVGYHVGMMNNWRLIVKDQLHTLHNCGLGEALTHFYITYSNNNTHNTLEELQSMVGRYPFTQQATFQFSPGQPVEGTAINAIHSHCRAKEQTLPEKEIVVFYFHTKGSSRYADNWQNKSRSYKQVLHWRKYMEYFTIERPQICIDHIINEKKYGCGVYWVNRAKFYGGNFWAAPCSYLTTLPPLDIFTPDRKEKRFMAEGWISEELRFGNHSPAFSDWDRFAKLHNPNKGLYKSVISPHEYADYFHRWGSISTV